MKRLFLLLLLCAFGAAGHEIPDGKTPKEKCETQCERKHCEDVKETRCYDLPERDRCRRSCAVST